MTLVVRAIRLRPRSWFSILVLLRFWTSEYTLSEARSAAMGMGLPVAIRIPIPIGMVIMLEKRPILAILLIVLFSCFCLILSSIFGTLFVLSAILRKNTTTFM